MRKVSILIFLTLNHSLRSYIEKKVIVKNKFILSIPNKNFIIFFDINLNLILYLIKIMKQIKNNYKDFYSRLNVECKKK